MAPKKTASKKRKPEEDWGERSKEDTEEDSEEGGSRMRKNHKNSKYIGAHVGIQGGIWKAIDSCTEMGGKCFALFLGSQRSWKRPPLDLKAAEKFRDQRTLQGFDPVHIVPHGSYLMNCGSPKEDVFEKSQALLVDELSRCSILGLNLYNFHPGSSLGSISTEQCMDNIAGAINHAHRQIPAVVTGTWVMGWVPRQIHPVPTGGPAVKYLIVLENMSGQGSTLGGKFSELKGIIDKVRDQTRVGVCLDTCHAFAAGYDLAQKGGVKAMLDEFDQEVGLEYLKAIHLNDSKGKLGCNLDRHEDIGKGHIGISAFRDIVNEPRLDDIPLILETPGRPGFEYAEQIELLYSLCKKR